MSVTIEIASSHGSRARTGIKPGAEIKSTSTIATHDPDSIIVTVRHGDVGAPVFIKIGHGNRLGVTLWDSVGTCCSESARAVSPQVGQVATLVVQYDDVWMPVATEVRHCRGVADSPTGYSSSWALNPPPARPGTTTTVPLKRDSTTSARPSPVASTICPPLKPP